MDDKNLPDLVERLQAQVGDLIQSHQELSRLVVDPEKLLPRAYVRSLLPTDRDNSRRGVEVVMMVRDRLHQLKYLLVNDLPPGARQIRFVENAIDALGWGIDDLMRYGHLRKKRGGAINFLSGRNLRNHFVPEDREQAKVPETPNKEPQVD